MQKLINILFGCDFLKGFFSNPEDYWLFSKVGFLEKLGRSLADKNKQKRLNIIESVNIDLTKKKLISIILPTFNAEETIVSTINSIQKQTYPHWELLVIDDGSHDNSVLLITQLAGQDSRIKVYKNKVNKGAAYSRNVGLFNAAGDFITFHDADDISHNERFECQLAELLLHSRIKLVVTQYVRVDKNNNILILNGRKKRNYISGMMFNRAVLDRIGYFKPLTISEDSEYHERVIATFGKKSRKILCKTLYYALFNQESLLFSNAKVTVQGQSINYKIRQSELAELEAYRGEHKKIQARTLSPYQSFVLDEGVTVKLND